MTAPRTEIARITVPYDVQRLSPNLRLHFHERARRTKVARFLARRAWEQAGSPRATGPVRVSLLVRRGRSIDQQNVWCATKSICDGIFCAGLTPDDAPEWVTLGTVTQEPGRQWRGREEVVLIVEALR